LPNVHGALAKVLDQQGRHEEAQREIVEEQQRSESSPRETSQARKGMTQGAQ
jgi:hypothetical protein